MSMSTAQARVGDHVLSHHARGFSQRRFVGGKLFPTVYTDMRGGKVVQFDKSSFVRQALRRAPGADAREITFGYEGEPYKLVQDSCDVKVPSEHMDDAQNGAGLDLGMRAVRLGMEVMTLGLEIEQAQLASDAALYPAGHTLALAGTDKWSHGDSDPFDDVKAAKEAIRAATGMRANTLIMGPKPYGAVTNHPKVLARLSGISADAIQEQHLAAMFGLEGVAEGAAVYTETEDAAAPFLDVWGDVAILAYVPKPEETDGKEDPSFGYTYTLTGHPFAGKPYWNDKKRSWMHPVDYERTPVLCGAIAGFMLTGVTE